MLTEPLVEKDDDTESKMETSKPFQTLFGFRREIDITDGHEYLVLTRRA